MMLRSILVIAIISTFVNTSSAMEGWIGKDSVVGIWLFDEGSGDTVKDISGNRHDGKIQGELKWVEGKFGKALEFDGVFSNYVEVADTEALRIRKDISMLAWVHIDGKAERCGVISKYRSAGDLRGYTIDMYDGRLRVLLAWDGAVNPEPVQNVRFPDWEAKTWYHLAGVYDGQTIKFYVDGEVESECEYNKGIFATTVPLEIGRGGSRSNPFMGIIDEAAVFNKALAQEEIRNIMANGLKQATSVRAKGKLAQTWACIKTQ